MHIRERSLTIVCVCVCVGGGGGWRGSVLFVKQGLKNFSPS